MSDIRQNPESPPPARVRGNFLIEDGPYILMLALALLGVALASLFEGATAIYWEILVPLFAIICLYTRWRESHGQRLSLRFARIEMLHWGAVFVAMQLVSMTDVSHVMNANGIGLVSMIVLAVGTFTAGAQVESWRICLVGAVLALGVPFVAWLTRATLLMTFGLIAAASLAAFFFVHVKSGKTESTQA